MAAIDHTEIETAKDLRERAARGVFDGDLSNAASMEYMVNCRYYCQHTNALIIFTRDACDGSKAWHLSISFCDITDDDITPMPFNGDVANAWATLIFGEFVDDLWIEGPKTNHGKQLQVWHYRLFVNDGWHSVAHEVPEYFERNCLRWSDLQQPANA